LKGLIGDAIVHREREIRLMERLHVEAQTPGVAQSTKAYMLQDRESIDLKERRMILESLKKLMMQQQKLKQPRKYRGADVLTIPVAT
jgi:triphosphoribosyl-dephospho-CoA synthetase